MSVVMYWEDEKSFEVWRESDAFKQAHKRPADGKPGPNSPVISSQIVIAKVAAEIAK